MTRTILPTTFEKLASRHRITAELEAVTALRVGAGKRFDITATDLPVIRDGLGRPFLPGSSLKGALRSGLEALLRGLGSAELRACDPLDNDLSCAGMLRAAHKKAGNGKEPPIEEIQKELCTVCGLFGSSYLAGRLFIHDLAQSSETSRPPEIRDAVCINRDLRTAQHRGKFDFEVVSPGTRFRLVMLLENGDAIHWALVLQALQLLDQGQILIGGLTSRGLGRLCLVGETVVLERINARRLLAGEGFEPLDYQAELQKAGEVLASQLGGGS